MDLLPALLLWAVGLGITMLVLYYVVRAAVRDAIGLADADRARRTQLQARKHELIAEEEAARERRAERERALHGEDAAAPPAAGPQV